MPEELSSTITWRRRLGFWDEVRWTRRHLFACLSLRLLPTQVSVFLTCRTAWIIHRLVGKGTGRPKILFVKVYLTTHYMQ